MKQNLKVYRYSLYNYIGLIKLNVLVNRVVTIDNVQFLGLTIEQFNDDNRFLKWIRLRVNILRLGKYLVQINKKYKIKGFLAPIIKMYLISMDLNRNIYDCDKLLKKYIERYMILIYPSFVESISKEQINKIVNNISSFETEIPQIVINYATNIKKESRTEPEKAGSLQDC